MYLEYFEFNVESCFVFALIAILGNLAKVPGLYRALEEKFSSIQILYASELSISFLVWYIMWVLLSIAANEGCKLCGTIWIILSLIFVFYICYLGNSMASYINFITYVLLWLLVWFLLVLSYTNIFILSNLAVQVSDINSFEALVMWSEADLKPAQTYYMYGRASSSMSKIGLRAFGAIHCLSCMKNPGILNPILHKTFFEEGGRLIGLKLNTLLPEIYAGTRPVLELVQGQGPGLLDLSYVQKFMLRNQGICDFTTMGLSECKSVLLAANKNATKYEFAQLGASINNFEADIRKLAAVSIGKEIGKVFEQICPVDSSSMSLEEFSTRKYSTSWKFDGLQIQEILGRIHLGKLLGLKSVFRPETDHQGDLTGLFANQKLYCDLKMFDSNLHLDRNFGEPRLRWLIKDAGDEMFLLVPAGLPRLIAIDFSATPVVSYQDFENKVGTLLAKIDPFLLKKCAVIRSFDQLSSERLNIIFFHELEILGRIDYSKIFLQQISDYEEELFNLWDNFEMKEKFSEYIVQSRSSFRDEVCTALIKHFKKK